MSESSVKLPLQVGQIISESFQILRRQFWRLIVLSLLPVLVIGAAIGALSFSLASGGDLQSILDDEGTVGPAFFLIYGFVMIAFAFYFVTLIQLAYESKLERSPHLGPILMRALLKLVPVTVTAVVIMVLASLPPIAVALALADTLSVSLGGPLLLGTMLFSLWIYLALSMAVPAVILEKSLFGALRRSLFLTKGYRWRIFGAVICTLLGTWLISMISSVIPMVLVGVLPLQGEILGLFVFVPVFVGIMFAYGFPNIALALIYARLREIKEGASLQDIAAVFD